MYKHQVNNLAFVAQWIAHQTSNLGVVGSSPTGGCIFIFARLYILNMHEIFSLFLVQRGFGVLGMV